MQAPVTARGDAGEMEKVTRNGDVPMSPCSRDAQEAARSAALFLCWWAKGAGLSPGAFTSLRKGFFSLPPGNSGDDRKGPRRDSTFQSYFCFSSCMSLPPTLKARMSLLVLAYLSFSLFRSGES